MNWHIKDILADNVTYNLKEPSVVLRSKAKASEALQDLVITPYEKLNIGRMQEVTKTSLYFPFLAKKDTVKQKYWKPKDLLDPKKSKFIFSSGVYLDKGHLVFDENNRIL